MSSDPKNYFGFSVDEIPEFGLTTKRLFLDTYQSGSNRIVNIHLNQFKVLDVSLEMLGDFKSYFGFS